jgi:hypothetical protein
MRFIRLAAILAIAAAVLAAGAWYCSGRGYGPRRKQALRQWAMSTQPGTASRGPLQAGVYRVDITPHVGVPLGGYGARHGRPSRGVRDRIYARALVLTNGRDKFAIVSCDLIGMGKSIRNRVLKRVRNRGFTSDNLLICATHTHSGTGAMSPEVAGQIAVGRFDPEVTRLLADALVAAVEGADDALQPAKIGGGAADAPEYIANRRSEDPASMTDPALTVVNVVTAQGKPLAVLCNYSAHATCLGPDNMAPSADYPGYVQWVVENHLGGGAMCMFTAGAVGDQAPASPTGLSGSARIPEIGNGLANKAFQVLDTTTVSGEAALAARTLEVRLPLTPLAAFAGTHTLVQAVAINDLLILAVPGEMAAEIGLRLKRRGVREMGFAHVAIVGLANDHVGYILTPEQMGRGGYEAAISFYGPQLGPLMEEAVASAGLAVSRMMKPGG